MGIPILILRLEGPLQSWGESSKFLYRDTSSFPTFSGVLGLIGCVLGYARGDKRLTDMQNKLQMAVRADKRGTPMTDFQTTEWGKRADGTYNAQNPVLQYKQYLQDACFTVALTGDEVLLEHIYTGFGYPVWAPYLGRKCCSPSTPICRGITYDYDSLEDCMENYKFAWGSDRGSIVYEIPDPHSGYLKRDVLFDPVNRDYIARRVNQVSFERKEESSHVSDQI